MCRLPRYSQTPEMVIFWPVFNRGLLAVIWMAKAPEAACRVVTAVTATGWPADAKPHFIISGELIAGHWLQR